MLAPVGTENTKEKYTPEIKQTTLIITETITTLLNFLQILIALNEGNTTRLEMSSVPIIRIPRTIVTAVRVAISAL